VTVTFPIEVIVDDNTLWWSDQSVSGFLKTSRESLRVRVDQPGISIKPLTGFGIEGTVGLKMVKLSGFESWNEDTPDIPPTINIPVEVDHFGGIAIIDMIIEKNSHPCG
jgi:hypothetical protein